MLDFFGKKSLDEITELEVLSYVRKRDEAGAKINTINNELIALRKTLYLAKRGRYEIDGLIKWGNCIRSSEFRERILSAEEKERLMPELADHLKPIVTCALNTGMRRGEILTLKWKNIVDGKIVLEAQNTKTKKQRCIPINSKLQQVFEILKSRDGFSEFVFTYGGKKMRDVQNGFSKACKRAKIDGLCFHDLRRTFATRLMRNGVGIYTISQLLGHADVKMTQRYINWQPEDGADAVESLVKNTPEKRNHLGIKKSDQFRIPLVTSVGLQ
jgi:integrase